MRHKSVTRPKYGEIKGDAQLNNDEIALDFLYSVFFSFTFGSITMNDDRNQTER